jgi:methionyl aminopeptidase
VIILKTPEELEKMRRAGRIVASTRRRVLEAVRPGITTGELDVIGEEHIRSNGAVPSFKGYRGFPRSICASVNEELVHGIPGDRALREGDLLSLDFGAIWGGYHGDSAVSVFVGEPPSDQAEKLVRVTEDALEAGLSQVRVEGRVSDIGHAVQQVVEGAGFGVVREYVGHGIGQSLHEDPPVPNYGAPGRGPELRPGMALAIEPMVTMGDWATRVLDDGWTVVTEDGGLCAHFEHTVALTDAGAEILTAD